MIALQETKIESIERELRKNIDEIDSQICESEQSMRAQISSLREKSDSNELQVLESQLKEYGAGVRGLRKNLAELERKTHLLVDVPKSVEDGVAIEKDKIANQIQKETHDAPANFSDFVKGLLMWREAPEDRMGA